MAGGRELDGEKGIGGGGGMGSSPGTGLNREPDSPAAVLGGRRREREGTADAGEPCAGGQLGGKGSAMWREAPSDAGRPLPVPSRLPLGPAPLCRLVHGVRVSVGVKRKERPFIYFCEEEANRCE